MESSLDLIFEVAIKRELSTNIEYLYLNITPQISAGGVSNSDAYAPIIHNHNKQYFTEDESKSLLDKKLNISTFDTHLTAYNSNIDEQTQFNQSINTKIQSLNGAAILIGTIDSPSSQITNSNLHSRANSLKNSVEVGYTLKDSDNVEWWCESVSGDSSTWNNIGQNIIGQATNSSHGVVKGSNTDNKISIESDGTMSMGKANSATNSDKLNGFTSDNLITKFEVSSDEQTEGTILLQLCNGEPTSITIDNVASANKATNALYLLDEDDNQVTYEDIVTQINSTGLRQDDITVVSPITKTTTGGTSTTEGGVCIGFDPSEYIPINHASSAMSYGVGNGTYYGHLKLTDEPSNLSTSNGTAATPALVNSAIGDIEIGGVNLLDGTSTPYLLRANNNVTNPTTFTLMSDEEELYYRCYSPNNTSLYSAVFYNDFIIGESYTCSLYVRVVDDSTSSIEVGLASDSVRTIPTNKWIQIYRVITATAESSRMFGLMIPFEYQGMTIDYKHSKLEKGNKATAWCESANDRQAKLDDKANTSGTYPNLSVGEATSLVSSNWSVKEQDNELLFLYGDTIVARLNHETGFISEKKVVAKF